MKTTTTRKRRRKESQDEWLKRAFTKIEGLVANLTIAMTMTNTERVTARYTKYVGHYIYIYALYPLMNLFESCLWWPNPSMAARAVIDGPWWSESHENVKTCCNMAEQVEDAKACSTWQRRLSFSCIYVPCTWVYISLHISFIPPCHFISWTHGGLKQNQGGSWRSTALKCVEVPALILEECRFQ